MQFVVFLCINVGHGEFVVEVKKYWSVLQERIICIWHAVSLGFDDWIYKLWNVVGSWWKPDLPWICNSIIDLSECELPFINIEFGYWKDVAAHKWGQILIAVKACEIKLILQDFNDLVKIVFWRIVLAEFYVVFKVFEKIRTENIIHILVWDELVNECGLGGEKVSHIIQCPLPQVVGSLSC